MSSPFGREDRSFTVNYAGTDKCVLRAAKKLNELEVIPEEVSEPCAICNGTLMNSSEHDKPKAVKVRLSCGHSFDRYCITQWLTPAGLFVPRKNDSFIFDPDSDEGDAQDLGNPAESQAQRVAYSEYIPRIDYSTGQLVENTGLWTNRVRNINEWGEAHVYPASPNSLSLDHVQRGNIINEQPEDELEEGEIREDSSDNSSGIDRGPGSRGDYPLPGEDDREIIEVQPEHGSYPAAAIETFMDDIMDDILAEESRLQRYAIGNNQCPLCRRDLFLKCCHADSLQSMRTRLRFWDLGYRTLNFQRTPEESHARALMVQFLNDRSVEQAALGDREETPRGVECLHLWTEAKVSVVDSVDYYLATYQLTPVERKHLMMFTAWAATVPFEMGWNSGVLNPDPSFNDEPAWLRVGHAEQMRFLTYQQRIIHILTNEDSLSISSEDTEMDDAPSPETEDDVVL